MFPVLARSAQRRTAAHLTRSLATRPPSRPPHKSSDTESPAPSTSQRPQRPSVDPVTVPPSQESLSLDFSPAEHATSKERTGARSSKDSLSSIERRRRTMARFGIGLLAVAVGAELLYMGREWEPEELKAKKLTKEEAPSTWTARTRARFEDIFDFFVKPESQELLPPPFPPPHGRPFTLLISLDDLLITSTWDRQHGWRTAKRPGVDYFLGYLSLFYEVVIFTSQYVYTAAPILEKLDPLNCYISHRLFRESTRFVDGKIVKDLSYLNRDLSKVILLDTHEEHASLQPENAIIMPKWTGDPRDKGLIAMIPFLESIAIYNSSDVRPIVEAYKGKDVPLEYAKKEAEAKARHLEEWKSSKKGMISGGFTLSSLFGGAEEQKQSPIPLTYLEQKRKEAQLQYKQEQAYFDANRGEFERLIEEDRQAMARQMSGSLWSTLGLMPGGQKPENEQQVQPVQADTTLPGTSSTASAVSTATGRP